MGGRVRVPVDLPDLLEVRCVNRIAHDDRCSRVVAIGGLRDGISWRLTQSEAIRAIALGDARFYVRLDNHEVGILIARSESGRRYLKCATDGVDPMSLLSLPECPRSSKPLGVHFDWARREET